MVNKEIQMAARKKVKEELSREMILEEANRHFLEHDYQQVSMRAIAKDLGCSHGAIYYHFANKSELYATLIERYFAELDLLIVDVLHLSIPDEERIYNLFLSYLKFGLNHQHQYRYMFVFKLENHARSEQAASNTYEKFAQTLFQLSNKPLNIFSVFASYLGLHGFVSHYMDKVSNFDEVQDAAKQYAHYLKNALVYN